MKYFAILYLLILASCTNSVREEKNNPADIKDAQEMALNFYDLMSQRQHSKLAKFCTEEESANDLKLALHAKDSILGNITNLKIIDITTISKEQDSHKSIEYLMNLEVDYSRGKNAETLNIIKEDSDTILSKYYFEPL